MAWTNISNALVSVGALPFATTIQALRDNPIAIANGDVGAPRIVNAAMAAPTAGSTHLIKRVQEVTVPIPFTTPTGNIFRFNCLISGTVRVYFEHRRIVGTIRTQVFKNNALVQQFDTTSTSFTANQVDVSLSLGDLVEYRTFMTTSGSGENGEIRNMFVYSGTPVAAVA
jgi:hypothetical protein